MLDKIPAKYFWFVKANDISRDISKLILDLNNKAFEVSNLDSIILNDNVIVCRENELEKLRLFVVGDGTRRRKPGSISVSGYGGVGKTAIVVEFLEILRKNVLDKTIECDYNFVLYYTFKEEILTLSNGGSYNFETEIVPQIADRFLESKEDITSKLGVQSISENTRKGIIVFDNIETLKETERNELFKFIDDDIDRNIVFILTSRDDEPCEQRIRIGDFSQKELAENFIKEYLIKNNKDIELNDKHIEGILDCSKGNTLIVVLMLRRIETALESLIIRDEKSTIDMVIKELREEFAMSSSKNIENIINFMYKNTFERAFAELEELKTPTHKILRIIYYFDEPIEFAYLCSLVGIDKSDIRIICNVLVKRSILDSNGSYYKINDFASKFIITKYISGSKDDMEIRKFVSSKKNEFKNALVKLRAAQGNPKMKRIYDDWGAVVDSEKLYIAQAYNMYYDARLISSLAGNYRIISFNDFCLEFLKLEEKTEHPYIRFQKARIFKEFFVNDYDLEIKTKANEITRASYEATK